MKKEVNSFMHNRSKSFEDLSEGEQEDIYRQIRNEHHKKVRANNIIIVTGRKSSYKNEAQFRISTVKSSYNLNEIEKNQLSKFIEKWEPYVEENSNVL